MVVSFNVGPAKLQVVKALKERLNLGLKEAKDMADAGEFVCDDDMYEEVTYNLRQAGASNFVKL